VNLSDASGEILKSLCGGATRESFIAAVQPEDKEDVFPLLFLRKSTPFSRAIILLKT